MNWNFRDLRAKRRDPLPSPDDPAWERALIGRLALEHLRDQQRRRNWGIVFKLLIALYLIGLLVAAYSRDLMESLTPPEDHVALIEVKGVIAADTDASADRIIGALRAAFEADHVKGVILRINSPGGSPVQAGYVNDEIRRLKAKYRKEHDDRDLPVHAVAVDVCASGGYYIAVAADSIHADKASLVGSIGVRIDSFGFQKVIEDWGIERRLLAAGDNKGILDPFLPLPESQRLFIQQVLDQLHRQFIDEVRTGRGDRLKGGDEIFSGLFWSGEEALDLGLIDGLGSASQVARDLIGVEKLVDYTRKRDFLESFARRLGASLASGLLETLAAGMNGAAPSLR